MCNRKLEGLDEQELSAAFMFRKAFETARNRHTISIPDWWRLRFSRQWDLNAANPYARITWGNALWFEFSSHFGMSKDQPFPQVPLFWVTLVDIGCFTKPDQAEGNISRFAYHLRAGLKGLSYLGMFDPGYYVHVAPSERAVG